jgi:sortase A
MFRSAGVRRSFLALLATAALVAGSCAAQKTDSQQVAAVRKPGTTVTAAPTTTTAAAAAAPARKIQRVSVLPGDRPVRAAKAAPSYRGPTPIGRIIIPRIGLNHLVYEGIELSIIDYGPGHWPGTAMPGEVGNSVFPGHRTTHSRPFYNIDLIQIGDHVTFTTGKGKYTYQVTEAFVVDDEETWIANPTDTPTMTIFGCHPKGSAKQRYVVKGSLVASERATTSNEASADGKTAPGDEATYGPPPEETTTTTEKPKSLIPRIGG